MFDLEQAISEWRRQMLAAGIKSPVPLEELESHLREQIEEQVKSGMSEQSAFEFAVREIGHAESLKTEFRNVGFLNRRDENTQRKINRIFAVIWLAYCADNFLSMGAKLIGIFYPSNWPVGVSFGLILALLVEIILLRFVMASIRLFRGNNNEIRILHYAAILALLALAPQIMASKNGLLMGCAAFNVASLILLRSPSQQNPGKATK